MTADDRKAGPKISGDQLRAPLQKRFYTAVAVAARDEGGFAVTLDGRGIKTPARRPLKAPVRGLADAVAAEWEAQATHVDPSTMPLTRLLNSAIDGVADRAHEVAAHIVSFAASDLVCYRAEAPAGLVRRQAEAWDPMLAWARESLGARFRVCTGVMPVDQPAEVLGAVERALSDLDPISLAALHVLTTLSGSAVLALAHMRGVLGLDEVWAASRIDETWQSEQWGQDAEADALAAQKLVEFSAASRCLHLLRSHR